MSNKKILIDYDLNNNYIKNLATPINAGDAANKEFIDNLFIDDLLISTYFLETGIVASPSTSSIRVNNSDMTLVTQIYIHTTDLNNFIVSDNLKNLKENDNIIITSITTPGTFIKYNVVSVSNNSTYYTINVTYNSIAVDGAPTKNQTCRIKLISNTINTTKVIDILHTDLVELKNTNNLQKGIYYNIIDFATIYDQPDFTDIQATPNLSPVIKTGTVTPIIVLATSNNTLSLDAYQPAHPKDSLKYILEYTTPVTNTSTKGRIIERIDERGNRTDFDHREVLFKRYLNNDTLEYIDFYNNGNIFIETTTFSQTNIQSNNYFGDFFNTFISGMSNVYCPFDLPNNVFYNDDGVPTAYNNIFSDSAANNTFIQDTINNNFSGDFFNNVFIDGCEGNTFEYRAYYNIFYNSVYSNSIKSIINVEMHGQLSNNNMSYFFSNSPIYIANGISSCNIKEMYNNTINCATGGNFRNITCDRFSDNIINNSAFYNVNINQFNGNTINKSFMSDLIFNEVNYNKFNGNFIWNKGTLLFNNTFIGRAYYNDFGSNMSYCTFGPNFGISERHDDTFDNSLILSDQYGNEFVGFFANLYFGANCGSNRFIGSMAYVKFGDFLVNNNFSIQYNSFNSQYLDLTLATHLYRSYNCDISTNRKLIGQLTLGDFPSAPYEKVYRTELVDNVYNNWVVSQLCVIQLPFRANSTGSTSNQNILGSSKFNSLDIIEAENNTQLYGQYAAGALQGYLGNGDIELNRLDYYLPSINELIEIDYSGLTTFTGIFWSSTSFDNNNAYAYDFDLGSIVIENKDTLLNVCGVRMVNDYPSIKLTYSDEYGSRITTDITE